MHGDVVDAMADFGGWVGNMWGAQPLVDGSPGDSPIVRAEGARRGDSDKNPLRIARVQNDGVQTHAAGARLPVRPRAVTAQPRQFTPRLPAIRRSEHGCIFDACVDRFRIGERWFQMPDALELPRMRRAVIPLVGAGHAVIHKLIADRRPCFAAIVRSLNQLAEPAARLRRVQSIRVSGRSLQVIDLPPGKQGALYAPTVALAIRGQYECSFARAHQYPNAAHASRLPYRIDVGQISDLPHIDCRRYCGKAKLRMPPSPACTTYCVPPTI